MCITAKIGLPMTLWVLLRPASHLLDKVEGFFLNPHILQEDRTPGALAKWLREADRLVQLATQQRKSFELIIKKFGSNARLIAG